MSTVMYCWRVKKKDFWPTMHTLKQDALKNHGAMVVAAELRRKLLSQQIDTVSRAQVEYDEDMQRVFQADNTGLLAMQIFDEGRTWLVRPLYCGFSLEEQIQRLKLPFREVWYDGRVGEGSPGGETKADWLDDRIASGEYLVHIILGVREPFNAVVFDLWPRGYEKTRDSGP